MFIFTIRHLSLRAFISIQKKTNRYVPVVFHMNNAFMLLDSVYRYLIWCKIYNAKASSDKFQIFFAETNKLANEYDSENCQNRMFVPFW